MSARDPLSSSKKRRRSTVEDDSQKSQMEPNFSPSGPLRPQASLGLNGLLDAMDIDSSQSQSQNKREQKSVHEAGGARKRRAKKECTSSHVNVTTEAEVTEVHDRRKRPKRDRTPEPVLDTWAGLSTPDQQVEPLAEPSNGNHGSTSKTKKGRLAASPEVIEASGSGSTPKLTPMQQAMKDKLEGGRFRLINETLYKSDSHTAHKMIMENPKTFEEYHTGFRRQVTSWPTNPVKHYISKLSTYSKGSLIVDLGCGDASLAKALIPKGYPVISFDLVSHGEFVTEVDICDKLPLPGAVDGGGRIVDVVVCALSLMSLNWMQCLREARRVLKDSGELKIAEVTSRFTDVDAFVSAVSDLGFKLLQKEHPTTHFTLFDFKAAQPPSSQPSTKEWQATLKSSQRLLKPCEYKRR
ncbi:25S rRNA (adenine645-N1)-methyltransferase [Tulasnella sp. JGI-2019a]|nr:25S rRNA (adenine645-N1)-methyltransferase [Tulasnella sp. JGI-2019a]